MDIDIKELKQFVKDQREIERFLTKDQVKIRRMFHVEGILLREIVEIERYYKNRMDLS